MMTMRTTKVKLATTRMTHRTLSQRLHQTMTLSGYRELLRKVTTLPNLRSTSMRPPNPLVR